MEISNSFSLLLKSTHSSHSKYIVLKNLLYPVRFTTQKVMLMATGPLMHRYKHNISPITNYHQMKKAFYTDPLYGKVTSLLHLCCAYEVKVTWKNWPNGSI